MNRVLIVDDQLTFRRQLRQLLLHAGFEVVAEAGDIATARQMIQRFEPDLAIVDVMLPEVSGLEGTPQLKALADHLQVILISAYQNFQQAAEQVGADAFIPKDELDLETVLQWKQPQEDHHETT